MNPEDGATQAPAESDAPAKENVALEGDGKDLAAAIAAALVEAGVKMFTLDASGEMAVVTMDGATAEFTADDLAALSDAGAAEETSEGAPTE